MKKPEGTLKKRERNSFLTPLVVEVMPDGKTFKVAREFTYLWKREYIQIHVAPGFVTDFASIPRFARGIIPKLGRYTKAAVIHDALYKDAIAGFRHKRSVVDLIFYDGMADLGVALWKRCVMWAAVRIFGGFAWKKRTSSGF